MNKWYHIYFFLPSPTSFPSFRYPFYIGLLLMLKKKIHVLYTTCGVCVCIYTYILLDIYYIVFLNVCKIHIIRLV